jgi:tRNA(fMet)-specific endonuclease VapC
MVCFDTDFLIGYLQKDQDAIKKLEELQAEGDTVAVTTTINATELWKGAYRAKDRQKETGKVKRLLDSLELITLDRDSARMAGELDAATKSNPIGDSDILIASIALSNNQVIITRKKKRFEGIQDLQIEGW